MFWRLGKPAVAVLEAVARHPGYAPMRAKHLSLLQQAILVNEIRSVKPLTHVVSLSCFPASIPLSQRFFDFRCLNDWREVQAVVDRLGTELSPNHLEAAYSRIKFLKLRPSTKFMDELASRAISLSTTMSPRNTSSILHACAKLQYFNPVMMRDLLQIMNSQQQIKSMDGLEVASMIYALGMLDQLRLNVGKEGSTEEGKVNEDEEALLVLQQEFMQGLSAALASGSYFEHFTEQQLGCVICGLGKLKCQDPGVHKTLAIELLKTRRVAAMKFLDLSSIWIGLGQMGFKPMESLNTLAEEVMKPARLIGFKPMEIGYIVYGCGLLQYQNRRLLDALMAEAIKEDRLAGFREKELANIVYALGVLGLRDQTVLDKLFDEVTRHERLVLFTQQAVENIMYSLRLLGRGSDSRMEILQKECTSHLSPKSKSSDVQLLVTAFGPKTSVAKDKVSRDLVKEVLDPKRMKEYEDDTLSGILNGLHSVGYTDAQGLEICLNEIKERLPRVPARILGYFAYGLRLNKISDQQMLNMLAEEITKPDRLAELTNQQLTGIFHTLCMLGWRQHDVVGKLLHEILNSRRLRQCSEQNIASIFSGLSEIGYRPGKAELLPFFKEIAQKSRLISFSERSLVNVVVSTAKLKCAPRELALPPLEELCGPGRLVKLRGTEVSQVVYNLGQLRCPNKRAIASAVREALKEERLKSFKRIELSMIIYGLGLLRLRDPATTSLLAAQAMLPDKLHHFKNHELANVVSGLSSMRLDCTESIRKLASETVDPQRMKSYKPEHFSNLFNGLCSFPVDLVASTAQELLDRIRGEPFLISMSETHIVQIALGLGNLGIKDFPGAQDVLEKIVNDQRLTLYKPFEIAHICYCIGRLQVADEAIVGKIVEEIMRPNRIPSMSQNELSVVSRNLSQVCSRNEKIFSAISEEMMNRFFEELPENSSAAV